MDTGVAVRSSRPWFAVAGLIGILTVMLAGYAIRARPGARPLGVDTAWRSYLTQHRIVWLEYPSLALNLIGGTLVTVMVTAAIMIAFSLAHRRWAAAFVGLAVVLAMILSTVIKLVIHRVRPDDSLVTVTSGAFPSGHTTTAAALAVSLALLFARWWVWSLAVVWVLAMAFGRTYLFAHWLSDTAGGAILGLSVALLLWAPAASRLRRQKLD